MRLTRSMGDDIAKVYGFLFPGSDRPLQKKEVRKRIVSFGHILKVRYKYSVP